VNRFGKWQGHAWLATAARLYIGIVFLMACVHKIAHPGSFALDIATYDIVPLYLVNLMAITLPWIELLTGILLVVGWRTRAAGLMALGMLAMFIAAISIALAKGLDISCGCFASQAAAHDDPISWETILRDSSWVFLTIYAISVGRRTFGFDRFLANRRKIDA
jgi:uncharacterized membrane protein YphA (DoxX/SURF4 family)